MEPQKNKDSVQNRRVRTLLVYLFLHIIRRPQRWQTLTLLGSRGKSRAFSRAFLCSSRDKHTALFPLQNSRHGRQVPPPLAEPTNRGLHFSQCLPWKRRKEKSSPVNMEKLCLQYVHVFYYEHLLWCYCDTQGKHLVC